MIPAQPGLVVTLKVVGEDRWIDLWVEAWSDSGRPMVLDPKNNRLMMVEDLAREFEILGFTKNGVDSGCRR